MGASAENYLETILILQKRLGEVRSVDVATELGYSKPSVSIAMRNLRMAGCVKVGRNGSLLLTERGRGFAEATYARHVLLRDWLISIGVCEKTATYDACRIEHIISEESVIALRNHIAKTAESEGR
jgi:Mn-dependent DtxR family transcriptional regulator